MNIEQAKQEIKNTVRAYLQKNKAGMYEIPVVRQRPILLMGAPGLGKTAIMRQIAEEMNIGFVSYNMTHHTRQSALGLPLIRKEEFAGRKRDVTAYTMSEIVASIYEFMKSVNINEGILFLDEINCVSETLSPVILQLLQTKVFGREKLPEGWILVAAGNPKEYNRSVREFDMATLDRVRLIQVEPDIEVWKNYASLQNIHGSVLSYLEIHRENFYKAYITADGMNFVTARGWEDLSDLIRVYESLGADIGMDQISQFIHDVAIAADFANFYEMYKRYETAYMIDDILNEGKNAKALQKFKDAAFDEQIGVIGLISAKLNTEFKNFHIERAVSDRIFLIIKHVGEAGTKASFDDEINTLRDELMRFVSSGLVSDEAAAILKITLSIAQDWHDDTADLEVLKKKFFERNEETERHADKIRDMLDNIFDFLEVSEGDGTQLVLFTTGLAGGIYSLEFMTEEGYERFFKYNRKLLGGND